MPSRSARIAFGAEVTLNPDQDQSDVIAFLSSPESYNFDGQVERIDTHAAIVFLARDKAFKLKRAVKYDYLDFSTRERRRVVCEAELRLNRRTAPELYLGVLSVNRKADGSLSFGAGEVVDWLVVMRRFASEDLLLTLAERGALTTPMVRSLTERIASFHAEAEIARSEDGAGRVRSVIEGNQRALVALATPALPGEHCERLCRTSLAELDRVAALLDRRAAQGHVRRCHGDLHLANICLWEGEPTLFDCLEFDEDMATIDVLYDLAFLLMDLWQRGFRAQASEAFNRYLDLCDEADGLAALPLFLSLRAAVRAHVGASAAGRQNDAVKRDAKRDKARDYLTASLAFLEPAPPLLVAVGGLSGTGKSTLAAGLAPHIGNAPGARFLRTDVVRKRLAGVAPEEALPPGAYTPESSARVYAHLMEQARQALCAGRSVIVDGVFAREDERARIAEVAREAGADFAGLWLEAPEAVMVRRVSRRTGDASDADADVVRRQLDYVLGELSPWRRIDASGPAADILADARLILSSSLSRQSADAS